MFVSLLSGSLGTCFKVLKCRLVGSALLKLGSERFSVSMSSDSRFEDMDLLRVFRRRFWFHWFLRLRNRRLCVSGPESYDSLVEQQEQILLDSFEATDDIAWREGKGKRYNNNNCYKEGRKKQASPAYKQQSKATQHTQGSHFSKKENELPRVGLEPTTLYTLDRALYH